MERFQTLFLARKHMGNKTESWASSLDFIWVSNCCCTFSSLLEWVFALCTPLPVKTSSQKWKWDMLTPTEAWRIGMVKVSGIPVCILTKTRASLMMRIHFGGKLLTSVLQGKEKPSTPGNCTNIAAVPSTSGSLSLPWEWMHYAHPSVVWRLIK